MRSIQDIFNAVIEAGLYSHDTNQTVMVNGRWFTVDNCMCFSVASAINAKLISEDEGRLAYKEIDGYIGCYSFLRSALMVNTLPHDFHSRLAIYRDWANRPTLSQTEV